MSDDTDNSVPSLNVVNFDLNATARKNKLGRTRKLEIPPEPPEAMKKRLYLTRNDLGAARRLEIFTDGDLLFCPEKGWAAWDGFRFDFKHGEAAAIRRAHLLHDDMMRNEAQAVLWQIGRETTIEDEIEKAVQSFRTWAKSCGNGGKIDSILGVLSRFEQVFTPLENLDPGWDFAVGNGVMRLSREHGAVFDPVPLKDDRMTRRALADWDERATAPEFERFLEKVQPDPAQRAFLQRVTGYCLAAGNPEQVFFFFQGKGGDGKSTFLNAVASALGDLVGDAQVATFLEQDRRGAEASPDIAALAGATRLVRVAEPKKGAKLDEGSIKQFTGGEPVTARGLHKELFSFPFRATCIMSCNEIPQPRGDDRGIWRRLQIVTWPVSIPKAERDIELPTRLSVERDGILRWIIKGFEDWLEHGLDPPVDAMEQVASLRRTASPLANWYDERCEAAAGAETAHSALLADYEAWRGDNGGVEVSSKAMATFLFNRGHRDRKSHGVKVRLGVRLRPIEAGDGPDDEADPAPF